MSDDPSSPPKVVPVGDTARRIASGATNLLASGLVLILGLVMGRQMLDAWHGQQASIDNPSALVRDARSIVTPAANAELQFGKDSGTWLRNEVEGSESEALSQLRESCRELAARSATQRVPKTLAGKWLEKVLVEPPAEHEMGKWRLHEQKAPLPMVVAVADGERVAPATSSPHVLAFGLAFPADRLARRWRTFVFAPIRDAVSDGTEETFILPADCERLVGITANSETVVGFRSDVPPATLAERWDSLQAGGWRAVGSWRVSGTAWQRRFEHADGGQVEVQFSSDSQNPVLGFYWHSKKMPPGSQSDAKGLPPT